MIVLPTLLCVCFLRESGHQIIDVQITSNYSFSLEGGHVKPRMDPNGLFGCFWPFKSWSIAKPQRHTEATLKPQWKPKDRGFTLWIPAWLEVAFCIPAMFCHDLSVTLGANKKWWMPMDAPIDGVGSVVQSLQLPRIWNYFGLFISDFCWRNPTIILKFGITICITDYPVYNPIYIIIMDNYE